LREKLAELQRPAADRFIGNIDSALRQHILDIRKLSVKRKYSQTA
jgi:hypothetical protein